MANNNNITNRSAIQTDRLSLYNDLQNKCHVPDASSSRISNVTAVFRGMSYDLAQIKESVDKSGCTPALITIYTDVLEIPDNTNLVIGSTNLVIYARCIESSSASIFMDNQHNASNACIVFADEIKGDIKVIATTKGKEQISTFNITQENISQGIIINFVNSVPACTALNRQQGIGMEMNADMSAYLNNSFIFGTLLYDDKPALALSILLWVKSWAAQSEQTSELFYRSATLATLLCSQINASSNGAVFVPYLTAGIYTSLAAAYVEEASQYENKLFQLSVQKQLTDENIAMIKTMIGNSDSEIKYIYELQKQAQSNYDNAVKAEQNAQSNFDNQNDKINNIAINFRDIGIPEYEEEQIAKAVIELLKAVVTFATGIAAMVLGDEAAAPAAAEGAANSAKAISTAAITASDIAKNAKELAATMKQLKKMIEAMKKIYELAKAIKEASDNIESATKQMGTVDRMKDTTDDADLSAADGWSIYQLQADAILQGAVDKKIQYAKDYKQAIDILVIYGQSLSASQLAVIKTSQEAAALNFRLQYANQKKDDLEKLSENLTAGEKPTLELMQQLFLKNLDCKSSLFSALKLYQASYFYWALSQSSINPQIIDSVDNIGSGIYDITNIAMDTAAALDHFNPSPQPMENILVVIDNEDVLSSLRATGKATWSLPLDNPEFECLDRVRLTTIRVWIEGISLTSQNDSVFITISTDGNYLDRYNDVNYQFNSKQLTRTFKYRVAKNGENQAWIFDDGTIGIIQIDGKVDTEVEYAYFEPTPFSEWTIALPKKDKNNPSIDYSHISKVTMYFEGSAIGTPNKK
jgi:hypothetical protein